MGAKWSWEQSGHGCKLASGAKWPRVQSGYVGVKVFSVLFFLSLLSNSLTFRKFHNYFNLNSNNSLKCLVMSIFFMKILF